MSDFTILYKILPDCRITKIHGMDITIECEATPQKLFRAEQALRKATGLQYELFMARKKDTAGRSA